MRSSNISHRHPHYSSLISSRSQLALSPTVFPTSPTASELALNSDSNFVHSNLWNLDSRPTLSLPTSFLSVKLSSFSFFMYRSIVGADVVDWSLLFRFVTDLDTRGEKCLGSRVFSFNQDSKDKAMH